MRLLIVGGKLQGTEAVYLAAKAGWDTVVVDRREATPASGLADTVVIADITADEARARGLVTACDAVLPACEDESTLAWLTEHVPAWGVPLLFDLDAYRVTSSKLASRRLFAELDVPRPGDWPGCGFPAVVKPSSGSGSEGVTVVSDEQGLAAARRALERGGHEVVVEEYVEGPSLSLEVLAWKGHAVPLQVTGLEFDAAHDCSRVVAPVAESDLPAADVRDWESAVVPGVCRALEEASLRVAGALRLSGVDGRRGDGEWVRAAAARDRRASAQPDADRRVLVEWAEPGRGVDADDPGRGSAGGGLHAAARLCVSTRARRWGYAGGRR